MTAPVLSVEEIRLHERDVTLRLPFRFGMITLREAPQAFVRCRVRHVDGREGWGMAAEMLVPKWFDKDPDTDNDRNIDDLRAALRLYADAITANGTATAFGHYAGLYKTHLAAGAEAGLNPLVASYGPALIDRAVMDALCRIEGVPFATAVRANLPGIDPGAVVDDLAGFDMASFLAQLTPSPEVHARHTVGMVDPLTAADQAEDARVGDGLPETLEEVIGAYGHTYFKLKVGGDLGEDLARLKAIAAVIDRSPEPYHATLDGNEQYQDVDGVLALLDAMAAEPALKRLCGSIVFVEQPIHRSQALERDVTSLVARQPVIIDESDADLGSFAAARRRGYSGVSSKDCKGFYKSLINLARCQAYGERDGRPCLMSAEDLTCQAGVAVQQDLALVALLGLSHVERNGHYYVNGMASAGADEQARFLAAHPDLYREVGGRVCTHIENGKLALGSLQCPGMGVAAEPDWASMRDMPQAG